MDLSELQDFANLANETLGQFRLEFILSPQLIQSEDLGIDQLTWQSVPYGDADKANVPNDKRGIYAFIINTESSVLPIHNHVLYIGIAGRKSNRSLRDRYGDYLNVKKVKKRASIARMIGTWGEILKFFYAPVGEEITSEQLELIEQKLNSALLPPFSKGDLTSEIRTLRSAF